jgi:hypothetical protein
MIKPFNFFRGVVGPRVVATGGEFYAPYIPLQITHAPPEGISHRHWNMLPQDLRGGERENMELYIEGWEASSQANYNNPYHDDIIRAEIWNRGWHAWFERRNGETYTERDMEHYHADREFFNRRTRVYTERDMEYYHTEEFLFFDVSEERYDSILPQPYKVMLFRSIEEGNTVEGQTIYPDHYMYNFPDVI